VFDDALGAAQVANRYQWDNGEQSPTSASRESFVPVTHESGVRGGRRLEGSE
jgi:hypothetical protein